MWSFKWKPNFVRKKTSARIDLTDYTAKTYTLGFNSGFLQLFDSSTHSLRFRFTHYTFLYLVSAFATLWMKPPNDFREALYSLKLQLHYFGVQSKPLLQLHTASYLYIDIIFDGLFMLSSFKRSVGIYDF